jgi:RNA methyltransferase, TrmH family
MKTITSRHNAVFKRVRTALHEHDAEIAIEGPKQVADAIAQGWRPLLTIHRGAAPDEAESIGFSDELFDALSETRAPQNVIAIFERPQSRFADLLARRDTVLVALDGVQDPGNVGTIVRLAAAFDCAGVALLPGCADPFAPKTIRSSVGAVLSVPIASVTHDELLGCGLPLFAADAHAETSDPPVRAAVLVFGSEGGGLSPSIRKAAKSITIRMSSRVESLNVATSAAILLSRSYEMR